jgi:hypothetical protein
MSDPFADDEGFHEFQSPAEVVPVEEVPEPAAEEPVTGDLAPASESSNAHVQALLAHRQTAYLNGDDEAIKAADDELAKLGLR